ncbi:Abi family protein [Bifidobacterium vansinderenii]|uniref:DNA-binding protein n=1 Tax=Bifidobacterium vansinderenii TaxID=1984871 RepID=A0A229VXL3_9BIFI|nr:Abi family protein [Bifidobacterium vansinderenii]OXN00369.1 DNA-binding protein [Bifidobacterium vansinderenii]
MKPAKNLDEMIELMKSRGLTVPDHDAMRRILFDSNYYRLSGYFRAFQNDPAHGDNDFKSDVTTADFLEPYRLDGELRPKILRGTALVELTVRSRFAYLVAQHGGAYSYADIDSYEPITNRKDVELRTSLISNIRKWMDISNEVCIRHYRKVGEPVPIWAAVETLPFDTVSRMLSLHRDTSALKELYRSLGIRTNLRTASEIIHAMVYLRNLCSHHSRLWHREMVIVPPVTRDMRRRYPDFNYEQRSVAQSLIALFYLADEINGDDSYSDELIDFLSEQHRYGDGIRHSLHWE